MKPLTRVARMLGVTREKAKTFCETVRASNPPDERPSDFDIIRALALIGRSDPSAIEVARVAAKERAATREVAQIRRGQRTEVRQAQNAARAGFSTSQRRKSPAAFSRCRFCRKPAVPGSDLCYGCAGK
jgi:hypothetical protein